MLETTSLTLLAYIGPDVLIPLASFAAAVLGAIMIGWRWFAGVFSSVVRFVLGRPAPEPPAEQVADDAHESEGHTAAVSAEEEEPQPARS